MADFRDIFEMGQVKKRKREKLKSRLGKVGGQNISDLIDIDNVLDDSMDELGLAMKSFDEAFAEEIDQAIQDMNEVITEHVTYGSHGNYTYNTVGGGTNIASGHQAGTSGSAGTAARPRYSHIDHGEHGLDEAFGHKIKIFEPKNMTEIIVYFNHDDDYHVVGNISPSVMPSPEVIKYQINKHLRSISSDVDSMKKLAGLTHSFTPKPKMPENESFKEYELDTNDIVDKIRFMSDHRHFMEDDTVPLFYYRSFFGGRGEPLKPSSDPKVSVSGRSMFGRKYEVRVDDNPIYIPEVERFMAYCYRDNNLDTFVEMRSDDEKVILRNMMEGLIALKIAEPYHKEIKELL